MIVFKIRKLAPCMTTGSKLSSNGILNALYRARTMTKSSH